MLLCFRNKFDHVAMMGHKVVYHQYYVQDFCGF